MNFKWHLEYHCVCHFNDILHCNVLFCLVHQPWCYFVVKCWFGVVYFCPILPLSNTNNSNCLFVRWPHGALSEWNVWAVWLQLQMIPTPASLIWRLSQIAKFIGPIWDQPWSCRPHMGPMLAPRTLLSGMFCSRYMLCLVLTKYRWKV